MLQGWPHPLCCGAVSSYAQALKGGAAPSHWAKAAPGWVAWAKWGGLRMQPRPQHARKRARAWSIRNRWRQPQAGDP
jgi:hypothetical protein